MQGHSNASAAVEVTKIYEQKNKILDKDDSAVTSTGYTTTHLGIAAPFDKLRTGSRLSSGLAVHRAAAQARLAPQGSWFCTCA
jgi:hypothetical protein